MRSTVTMGLVAVLAALSAAQAAGPGAQAPSPTPCAAGPTASGRPGSDWDWTTGPTRGTRQLSGKSPRRADCPHADCLLPEASPAPRPPAIRVRGTDDDGRGDIDVIGTG